MRTFSVGAVWRSRCPLVLWRPRYAAAATATTAIVPSAPASAGAQELRGALGCGEGPVRSGVRLSTEDGVGASTGERIGVGVSVARGVGAMPDGGAIVERAERGGALGWLE